MLKADPNTTNTTDYTTVDHKLISEGNNNPITRSVYYEFGQTDKSTVYMVL
jgi:hypothetical protein